MTKRGYVHTNTFPTGGNDQEELTVSPPYTTASTADWAFSLSPLKCQCAEVRLVIR